MSRGRRPADGRGRPRAARSARHRRHRADAPRRGGRHADRRGLRALRSARATRRAGRTISVVRIDLPCSPCNRIRLPPARCVGHTPDCLACVSADSVFAAAMSVLDASAPPAGRRGDPPHDDDVAHRRQRTGARRVALATYLDAGAEERAHDGGARLDQGAAPRCSVDGQPFRRRFTLRGDSLWWFAELYLHKQQVDPAGCSARSRRSTQLIERERPLEIGIATGSRLSGRSRRRSARARKVR